MTDADSTLAFLRDKKIQKMLEGNAGLRIRREEETDYSDSEEGRMRFFSTTGSNSQVLIADSNFLSVNGCMYQFTII